MRNMEMKPAPFEQETHLLNPESQPEFADFWLQSIPESYEQSKARGVLEDLGFNDKIIDELNPEEIHDIQEQIVKRAKGHLSLWSVAYEVAKKLVDNLMEKNEEPEDIRRLLQEVMGFNTYTIPQMAPDDLDKSKIIEGRVFPSQDNSKETHQLANELSFPAVSIFELKDKVGDEKAAEYLQIILTEWDKLQDKVDLAVGDVKTNLFVPGNIAFDDIRSMKLFLTNHPEERYAGNMILVKSRLEMAAENLFEEDSPSLYLKTIRDRAHQIKIDSAKILETYGDEIDKFIESAQDSFLEAEKEADKEKEVDINLAWVKVGSEVQEEKVRKNIERVLNEDLNTSSEYKAKANFFNSANEFKEALKNNFSLPDLVVLSFSDDLSDEQKIEEFRKLHLLQDKSLLNKLVRPIIAVEIRDDVLDAELLEEGADFILRTFSVDRGQDLIKRVAEMKKEAYGGETLEELSEEKEEFYDEVSDIIAERQKVTADTIKEVKILSEVIQNNFKNKKIDILDAGCGYGRLSIPLARQGHHITGVDLSSQLLEMFKKQLKNEKKELKVDIKKDNLTELSLEDDSQDMVMFNWHVFCELRTEQAKFSALKETLRVLRNGGVIVLDVPDRRKLQEFSNGYYVNKPEGKEVVYRGYIPSIDEINKWLYDTGFENVRVTEWKTSNDYPKLSITAEKI